MTESDSQSGGHVATRPAGVVAGELDEIGPTCRTVVSNNRFATGNVHGAATLHASIFDDGRTVRTDPKVVYRQFAQGFELFIQEILIDNRLAVLTQFHDDACCVL